MRYQSFSIVGRILADLGPQAQEEYERSYVTDKNATHADDAKSGPWRTLPLRISSKRSRILREIDETSPGGLSYMSNQDSVTWAPSYYYDNWDETSESDIADMYDQYSTDCESWYSNDSDDSDAGTLDAGAKQYPPATGGLRLNTRTSRIYQSVPSALSYMSDPDPHTWLPSFDETDGIIEKPSRFVRRSLLRNLPRVPSIIIEEDTHDLPRRRSTPPPMGPRPPKQAPRVVSSVNIQYEMPVPKRRPPPIGPVGPRPASLPIKEPAHCKRASRVGRFKPLPALPKYNEDNVPNTPPALQRRPIKTIELTLKQSHRSMRKRGSPKSPVPQTPKSPRGPNVPSKPKAKAKGKNLLFVSFRIKKQVVNGENV